MRYKVTLVNRNNHKKEFITVDASSHGEAWDRAKKALEFRGKNTNDYYIQTSHRLDGDTATNTI